jgi:hypothetical protein
VVTFTATGIAVTVDRNQLSAKLALQLHRIPVREIPGIDHLRFEIWIKATPLINP